jgi:hypothetical protein
MKPNTKTFLLAVAASLSAILTAFVVWINSFDEPAPAPEPPPVVVVPPPEPLPTPEPPPPPPTPTPGEFALSTRGPSRVYAGHDLYFLVRGTRTAGNPEHTYIAVISKPAGVTSSLPDIARTCCTVADGTTFMWEADDFIYTAVCLNLPATLTPGDYSAEVEIKNSRTQQTVKHLFSVLPKPTAITPTFPALPTLPSLAKYNQQMVEKGREQLGKRGYDTWEGNAWYYDGTRVAYQIADYTGDQTFAEYAKNPLDVYRPYVIENGGGVPGWRVFAQGLRMHYERTGDTISKEAAISLLNASYGPNGIITADLIPEIGRAHV